MVLAHSWATLVIDGSELTLLPGEGHMIQHLSPQDDAGEVEAPGFSVRQDRGAMRSGGAGQAHTKA